MAAMTATEAHAKLKSAGVSDSDLAACKALEGKVGAFNWSALLTLITQYGPAIVQAILAIFAQPAPAPAPPVQRT